MTELSSIYQTKWPANPTFAEPSSDAPLGDEFSANERATRLTGNIVSESAAREEAYDRRIEAVRQVTGVTLENPERAGYAMEARGHLRQDVLNGDLSPIDERAGVAPYRRRVFDQKVAELQAKHPELEFGGIEEEAQALGTEAQQNLATAQAQPGNPILKLGAQMAGGLWGSRRDPLFLGTLFAGPEMAFGRTALAKIATETLGLGVFNAGLTGGEQYAIQDWLHKTGQPTGIGPGAQAAAGAFAGGVGLGVVGGVFGEALKAAFKSAWPSAARLLRGRPEPGDTNTATKALGPQPAASAMTPEEIIAGALSPAERAMKAGEDSLAADKAVLTEKPPDVPPEMHDNLVAAALKRADDPEAPSPQAVAAVEPIVAWHASPHDFDAFKHPTEVAGTGEGAQSYGHGLYFAENPEVSGPEGKYMETFRNRSEGPTSYQVRIHADRDMMLDLDKPLREQNPQVQAAIKQAYDSAYPQANKELRAKQWQEMQSAQGPQLVRSGVIAFDDERTSKLLHDAGIPGNKYLDQGSRIDPTAAKADLDQARSAIAMVEKQSAGPERDQRLAQLRDWHDRAEKEYAYTQNPTQNFVIFDHNDVEITHKNGVPVQKPIDPELQDRIAQANPRNPQEAMAAADQALDDFGRRDGMAALQERIQALKEAWDAETEEWRGDHEELHRTDIRNKVPMQDRNGNDVMRAERYVRQDGNKEDALAALVKECK